MLHNNTGSYCRTCGGWIPAFTTHACPSNLTTLEHKITSAAGGGAPVELPGVKSILDAQAKTMKDLWPTHKKGIWPTPQAKPKEAVDHPDHYAGGAKKIECIDAIEAALTPEEFRGFCKGSAFKYLWREGKKDEVTQEIKKGIWYMNRMISGEEIAKS